MYKLISFLSIFLVVLSASNGVPSYAQYQGSTGVSGVSVDKKIRDLKGNVILDNISKSQRIFLDGETIEFLVTVENSASVGVTNVTVTDNLPQYLKMVFYPGKLVENRIEWKIDNLGPGETKVFNIRAVVDDVPNTIMATNPKQMTNTVKVGMDSDRSSYYVANVSVPITGDLDLVLKTMIAVSSLLAGLMLRKLARGY